MTVDPGFGHPKALTLFEAVDNRNWEKTDG